MRKVSQTAAEIVKIAQQHISTCMTFDSCDDNYRRDDTEVSVWFLQSSDDAEVTITIVEDDERNTYDHVSISVSVIRHD